MDEVGFEKTRSSIAKHITFLLEKIELTSNEIYKSSIQILN